MRYLLVVLIFFLTACDVFGWTQSFAPGLSVKNALIYLMLLTVAARLVVQGGGRFELPRVHLWFGILIAYATLSWLTVAILIRYESYELVSSGIALKAELLDGVIAFALYLYGTRTTQDAKFVLKCILFAVAVANAITIGDVAGLFQIGSISMVRHSDDPHRVMGAFGHANESAALIACLLPAYVTATASSRGALRWLWALAGVVSLILMVMTASRGAFVGLLVAALAGSYICRDLISLRRAAIVAAALLAIIVTVLALVSAAFGDVMIQRVMVMILDPGTRSEDRTIIWLPYLDRMVATPLTLITGFGWGAIDVMGFRYGPHNHYLALWFELGILGIVSFLMVIKHLVTTARRAAENATHETAAYMIAFVYGMIVVLGASFFAVIYKPWLYIWAYAGLTMRMAVISIQGTRSNSDPEEHNPGVVGRRIRSVAPSPRAPPSVSRQPGGAWTRKRPGAR